MVQIESAVEPGLQVVADGREPYGMPLAQRRGLHPGGRQLPAPTVVGVEAEVILERVGPHDVVPAVIEAHDDAARRVLPA